MDFEDILLDVGDYGKFQKRMLYFFLIPAAIFIPWFCMDFLFMTMTPDHWCYVPEVAASNLTIEQQRSIIGPPGDMCNMYNISFSDIDFSQNFTVPNGTVTVPCNMGWQYDKSSFESTVSSQFDLVCSYDYYPSFAQSMYNVGSMVGTPIYGCISDRYGRKLTFFIIVVITAVTGMASSLAKSFTTFLVIKTINGSLYPTIYQVPFIIVLEIVAPEMRTRMNGVTNLAWVFGMLFLPLIAYYSRTWVIMGLFNSAVVLLMLLYYKFLPESPRWLLSMERYDAAATNLVKIAATNGKHIEKKEIMQKLQKLGDKMKREKGEESTKAWDMVRYPGLRKKFIIVTICWISNGMSYYGLQLNTENLAGSPFVNFFLLALSEAPGYFVSWFVMEKFGRRWSAAIGFGLTGFVMLLPIIEFPHGDVICSMIGKFFAALTFMVTYQQSSELYPTVVRSLGMGLSCTISILVCLVVPYLVYLAIYGKAIPFVAFGITSMVAGFLAAFLPETLNENLPQTLFDAEEFGKDQKFYSVKRRRCSVSRERRASSVKDRPDNVRGIGNISLNVDQDGAEAQNLRKRTTEDVDGSGENGPGPTERDHDVVFKSGSEPINKLGNVSPKSKVDV
ncbi:hypothetical protein JTE90_029032 [Oedothorax gibbosus]|uniref:Major facilitator superfamily (MFS) profile domain-containing protein n=1 Tax=Oedothorax gibbosus TaxID=931172 RepID=A0AAV6UJP9_9ARAC|nr:hypothetical protein JTE90_029032 [Oedothorax gibbosus]